MELVFGIIGLVLVIIIIIIAKTYCIEEERKLFNNAICTKCGHYLTLFDRDSQGGRGYECKHCRHIVWVSYDSVDKNYLTYLREKSRFKE